MSYFDFETMGPPVGDAIEGPALAITRESIGEFADASLDYNPLHLDDSYMEGNFGRTHFGGVIMHGMTNFGLITRMLTDWAYARGAIHRRLETRWLKPVRPGDTLYVRIESLRNWYRGFNWEKDTFVVSLVSESEAEAEMAV